MAKSDTEKQTQTIWGTWEELVLACAVHRYGTKNWDSVATEIQNRSSNLNLLTAQACKQKFHDLKRRFDDLNDDVSGQIEDDDDDDDNTIHTIPWVDELKKLRVAELKREVERYDLNIVSLQLKVKRLKEERHQSSGENDEVREKSDLERKYEEAENRNGDAPDKSSPENSTGKPVTGEMSDRDNQSVNESNSTDPIVAKPEEAEEKPIPAKPDQAEERRKPVGEDSYNGSSDTIAKESAAASPVEKPEKVEPARESGESPELWESMSEEGTKENSDVQSSVKSHPENDDQSFSMKRSAVKLQPLIEFLEIIRSHRLGSRFENRLESQETTRYASLIRQHIDMETIRARLEEDWYAGSTRNFFRDLLLLFNNAVVFFGKKSSESTAAVEIRRLVSKEMTRRVPRSKPHKDQNPNPVPPSLNLKLDTEPSNFLLVKPKISGPIIVCRKRSSISAKTPSSGAERKKEPRVEEKPILNWKQNHKSSSVGPEEEHHFTKKRSKESNGRNNSSTKKSKKNSEGNSNENIELIKMEKKNNNSDGKNTNAKKQSAADFLNRLKRVPLTETKSSVTVSSENSRGGGEHKKNGSSTSKNHNSNRKEQGSRKGNKQGKEQGSSAKRSVGRPPKRAAAPPVSLGKRTREGSEGEVMGSRLAKKRSKK